MAKTPTIGIVSLGCPKALVDSERIVTRLRSEGYALSGDYAGADLRVAYFTWTYWNTAAQRALDQRPLRISLEGEALAACLAQQLRER